MLRFLFWPFKEFLRFFAVLWILVTFTSIGNYVDGRSLAFLVIEKAVHGWNQARLYVAEASARVSTPRLETIRLESLAIGDIDTSAVSDKGGMQYVSP
ncbi:MAG: hypothetical protein A3G34_10415 [Candidatus Lindowbacteria bacterium RIFCSPLOWO2_12_FULL_62_27]|nr:MAG: hypothetical protein A3G34_10415 [Candidatus Lindowbacteria bacterium RIFCSPLOWO2_12_FULL_62_27]OGH63481.1 MAG: hypothetical protein A3I06_12130 [Candidatus Lindowbacteria bacterium RIFCSPLOWO2_02_FULL_62_12]